MKCVHFRICFFRRETTSSRLDFSQHVSGFSNKNRSVTNTSVVLVSNMRIPPQSAPWQLIQFPVAQQVLHIQQDGTAASNLRISPPVLGSMLTVQPRRRALHETSAVSRRFATDAFGNGPS